MKILTINDKNALRTLRQISGEVKHFDHSLRSFIEQMKDTCYERGGAGLSAIQVGKPVRVLIYALDLNLERFAAMINPVIKYVSFNEIIHQKEGCLSLPNKEIMVPRYKTIFVSYQDGKGNHKTKKLKDFMSIIVQHEMDHLNGKLLIDYE